MRRPKYTHLRINSRAPNRANVLVEDSTGRFFTTIALRGADGSITFDGQAAPRWAMAEIEQFFAERGSTS